MSLLRHLSYLDPQLAEFLQSTFFQFAALLQVHVLVAVEKFSFVLTLKCEAVWKVKNIGTSMKHHGM